MSAPGTTFGRYFLETKLASGGMGEVFLARMGGAGGFEKRVVIKRVLPHLAESPEFVDRFLDEGRIVVRLAHSNIAQVLDMGEVDGQFFMAIEYVDGIDLRELIRRVRDRAGLMPVELALFIIAELGKGLEYAHSRVDDEGRSLGIIHRDVSPSNVVISRGGEVKLLDFGIATAKDRRVHSVSGALHGKFAYMSPEQASGKPLDRRSDLFSLGTLAYELMTGLKPFDDKSELRILDLIRAGAHQPLAERRPGLPAEVLGVVERCLEVDPSRRYQSGDELFRAVQQAFLELRLVVTQADLANYLRPIVPTRAVQPAALSLDDALNQELEALLSDGRGPGGATRASPRVTPAITKSEPPRMVATGEPQRPITATTSRAQLELDQAVPKRSRSRILIASVALLVLVLVVLNVAMLSALRERERDGERTLGEPPSPGPVAAIGTVPASSPRLDVPPAAVVPAAVPPPVPAGPEPGPLPATPAGSAPSPVGEWAQTRELEVDTPAIRREHEASAGAIVAEPPGEPHRRQVIVDVEPPQAGVFVGGKLFAVGTARLTVERDQVIRGEVRLDGFESAPFTAKFTSRANQRIALRPAARGEFLIRVLPATVTVKLDGVIIPRSEMVIKREASLGPHKLTILALDGTVASEVPFTIVAGQKPLKLGTVQLK